ncbi:CLUMA_CG021185, isoform A [Clunio marinus]|uniref:CLUMA_CG021185, isoform A n=1 Tax=Clunio marinus TaxID=568069 RepID=A0A1J1J857_9DIPT|nr:CLUMA_CG021185, isoform A [Clunio marinus]
MNELITKKSVGGQFTGISFSSYAFETSSKKFAGQMQPNHIQPHNRNSRLGLGLGLAKAIWGKQKTAKK